MDLTVLLGIVLGTIGLLLFVLYRFLTRDHGYWEARGLPTVKPHILYGSLKDAFSKPPADVENERYRKYGRMFGTYEFNKKVLNIAEPELIRQVLVKDFHIFTNRKYVKSGVPMIDSNLTLARDETWKRIRSVVSPSFTSGKMRKMNCHFVEAAEGLIRNLTLAADSKELVDAKKYFSSYSLDVIGLSAFGIRVNSLNNPDHPFTVNSRKLFARDLSLWTLLVFFIPGFLRVFGNLVMKRMGFGYFIEVTKEIIRKRRDGDRTSSQVDFIQLMLDAREESDEINDEQKEPVQEGKRQGPWNINKRLSDDEIHVQAMQFFSAGQETTSTALAFVAYELALNPDVQERVFQEVADVHRAHGEFNYDTVAKMTYLEAVISETLRLHTPGLKLEREASEDYVLGSSGVTVPKGAVVNVLIHCIHHDPEWYPDPEKFQPDRFLPENRSSLTPFTFLPFGDGPRNCVAMRFVMLKIKLCMAMVLKEIKFIATDETKQPIQFFNSGPVLIPKEIKMGVEKRTYPPRETAPLD